MKLQEIIEAFTTPAPEDGKWSIDSRGNMTYEFPFKEYRFRVYLINAAQDILTRFNFPKLPGKKIYQVILVQHNEETDNWQTEPMGNIGNAAISVYAIAEDALAKKIGSDAIYIFTAKRSKDPDELTVEKRASLYNKMAWDLSHRVMGNNPPITYKNNRGEHVFIISKVDITDEFETLIKYDIHEK